MASADKSFDLSQGQTTVQFNELDYEFPDDDDGFINIAELNNAGWDPSDSANPGISDDNYELNDSAATAYDITDQEGIAFSEYKGKALHADDDWFKVDLSKDRPRIRVEITAESSRFVYVELIAVGGAILSDAQHGERGDYIVPHTGTYYLRLYGTSTSNSK